VLGSIGADAAAAVPELSRLLREDQDTSAGAADALAKIGAPSIKALTAAANDGNDPTRALAVHALFRIGAPAIPTLIDLVSSRHADVRGNAAASLGNAQSRDRSVVLALSFATKDPDRLVRMAALQAIRTIGPGAKLAEANVVDRLTDIDQQVRLSAFRALQSLGVDPFPGMKKALAHPELATRIKVAVTMTDLNYEIELAAPVLLDGIKQKDISLKMQSANALSLRSLRPDDVLPIFIDRLKDKEAHVRKDAAIGIARYGSKGAKAAPALVAVLDDPEDDVVSQAMTTLKIVGGDPKTLFPAMVNVLRRKNTALHPAAAHVIHQVGPDAVDDIVGLLKKEDAPGIRLACLQTLAMIGPRAKNAVGVLTKALEDPAPRARMNAARALGNIGPDAKDAEEALMKAEKDDDANVRSLAKSALEQIKADPNKKEFEVKGVLTPGDPFDKVRPQMFHVVHTFQMKKGTQYQINLVSQWDNYLRLENSQGTQLAQDDDGGGFPNARLNFVAPEDGWYRLIVTSYGPGMNGPYTLRVK
jgi:HEAT repeat protein